MDLRSVFEHWKDDQERPPDPVRRNVTGRLFEEEIVKLDLVAHQLGLTRSEIITDVMSRAVAELWEVYEDTEQPSLPIEEEVKE